MKERLANAYLPSKGAKAIALGRGRRDHAVWGRTSESGAMRSALQSCAYESGGPCVVYALNNDVMVRTPQTVRVVDVLTWEDLPNLSEADRRRLDATYSPDADWRALAMDAQGKLGVALREASEGDAVARALRACEQAGGTGCVLRAVGPFRVAAP